MVKMVSDDEQQLWLKIIERHAMLIDHLLLGATVELSCRAVPEVRCETLRRSGEQPASRSTNPKLS
jgi:hypothetical protein